jgi:hypothetical protein
VTRRLVERPDRKGTSSAAAEQAEAGIALLDHVAQTTRAEELSEQASYATWAGALALRRDALVARYRAWSSGRRALRILADAERLETTLRPETPGSIEGPVWLDPDVVELVGAGVALAAIRRARASETLSAEQAEPIFALLEAEAHAAAGRWAAARRRAEAAAAGLMRADVMLRARAHLRAGQGADEAGDRDAAREHFARVLEWDPGLFRRLGVRLPVIVTVPAGAGDLERMADEVRGSPRFRATSRGFVIRLDPAGAELRNGTYAVLRTLAWPPAQPDEPPDAYRRRCLDALHARFLAAPVDLSQSDVRSLDGSVGGGSDVDTLLDGILDEAR